jgi:hypothetical protein
MACPDDTTLARTQVTDAGKDGCCRIALVRSVVTPSIPHLALTAGCFQNVLQEKLIIIRFAGFSAGYTLWDLITIEWPDQTRRDQNDQFLFADFVT